MKALFTGQWNEQRRTSSRISSLAVRSARDLAALFATLGCPPGANQRALPSTRLEVHKDL